MKIEKNEIIGISEKGKEVIAPKDCFIVFLTKMLSLARNGSTSENKVKPYQNLINVILFATWFAKKNLY